MLQLAEDAQVYLSTEPADMRKAIDGLVSLVVEQLNLNPQSGCVFLFRNKQANKVKALIWNKNGFVLHYKRLEKGRFRFPKKLNATYLEITSQQLSWLLAGLDFMLMDTFSELDFSTYY